MGLTVADAPPHSGRRETAMSRFSHAVRGPWRARASAGGRSPLPAHAPRALFGIARRGAVWCPINPRNTMAENREMLALFDCVALLYARSYAEIVEGLELPTLVCLDELDAWLGVQGEVESTDVADARRTTQ